MIPWGSSPRDPLFLRRLGLALARPEGCGLCLTGRHRAAGGCEPPSGVHSGWATRPARGRLGGREM